VTEALGIFSLLIALLLLSRSDPSPIWPMRFPVRI